MLHHIGIYVTDIERSVRFYETILPILEKEKLQWNDTELLFLKGAGFQLELIPGTLSHAKSTHIAFVVKSVPAKIQEFRQLGLSPSEGPFQLQNGWETVFFEGPDGEEIEFLQCTSS